MLVLETVPTIKVQLFPPNEKASVSNSFLWKDIYHTGAVPNFKGLRNTALVSEKQVGQVLLFVLTRGSAVIPAEDPVLYGGKKLDA